MGVTMIVVEIMENAAASVAEPSPISIYSKGSTSAPAWIQALQIILATSHCL